MHLKPPNMTLHNSNELIAQGVQALAAAAWEDKDPRYRVSSLDNTPLAGRTIVNAVGIPVYLAQADLSSEDYAAFSLSESGWYVFARIAARADTVVGSETTVAGAAGYVAEIGENHVDVAVKFGATAPAQTVSISWGDYEEDFVFTANDLAIRNLDYRTTFYIYDIAPYADFEYAVTADTVFDPNKDYFIINDESGEYEYYVHVSGDTIPQDVTIYERTHIVFRGMVPNVTYRYNEPVNLPIKIYLPEIPDDGHGAWFEIQMHYEKSVSCTLIPEDMQAVIGTATTQAQTAGMNTIDLQYTHTNGYRVWTLLNTHTNFSIAH